MMKNVARFVRCRGGSIELPLLTFWEWSCGSGSVVGDDTVFRLGVEGGEGRDLWRYGRHFKVGSGAT